MGGGTPPEVMTIVRYQSKQGTQAASGYTHSSTTYVELDASKKAKIVAALGLTDTGIALMNGTINIYEHV